MTQYDEIRRRAAHILEYDYVFCQSPRLRFFSLGFLSGALCAAAVFNALT